MLYITQANYVYINNTMSSKALRTEWLYLKAIGSFLGWWKYSIVDCGNSCKTVTILKIIELYTSCNLFGMWTM